MLSRDGAFITKGYDASTHFESTIDDVLDVYYRITGKVRTLFRSPASDTVVQTLDLDSEDPMVAKTEV